MARNKTEDQTDPTYEHKVRIVREDEERKKNTKIVEEYITVSPNPNAKRGGKVLKVIRTSSGYKHSLFLGRELDKGVKEFIAQAKKEGTFKPFGG